jgi:hypothetical protein
MKEDQVRLRSGLAERGASGANGAKAVTPCRAGHVQASHTVGHWPAVSAEGGDERDLVAVLEKRPQLADRDARVLRVVHDRHDPHSHGYSMEAV